MLYNLARIYHARGLKIAKLRVAYLFLFLLMLIEVYGQTETSIRQKGRFEENIEQDVFYFIERARMLANIGIYDSALYLIDKAKPFASDSAILSKCFRIEGQIHARLNNFKCAGSAGLQALKLLPSKPDQAESLLIHNLLGMINILHGDFEAALIHFYESSNLVEKAGDESEKATILVNIGVLYYKMFDYSTANEYWRTALELEMSLEDSDICKINAALAYINLGNYGRASALIKPLYKRVNTMSDRNKISLAYSLGTLYDSLRDYDSARMYFKESYVIAKYLDPRYASENLLSLARIQNRLKRNPAGEQLLNDAEAIAREKGFQDIVLRCLWERIRLSALKGALSERIRAQDEYLAQRKIFYDVKMSKIAAAHKQRFRHEDHTRQLQVNRKHLDVSAKLTQTHTRLQVIIVITAAMLTVLVVLVIWQVRMRNLHKLALEKAVRSRIADWEERNTKLIGLIQVRDLKMQRMNLNLKRINQTQYIITGSRIQLVV